MAKKQSSNKHKSPMVWRIFHFDKRFEMDSYRRQGGLDYMRMFVTATTADKSNESSEFLAQLAELEHYYPEQRDAYEGRFWRLGRLTATQEDWLRGYLLNAEQQPLTAVRLAARLHLSVAIMKQTLAALKRVGLIEYVPCPQFERPQRNKKEDKKKDDSKNKGKDKGRGKSGSAGKKTKKKKTIRKRSETFGNVSESFKKSESDKSNKIGIENRKKSEKEILGLKSSDKEKNQRGEKRGSQKPRQIKGESQDRTTTTPTTTPPISPTKSDEGGSAKVIPFAGPPNSVDGHIADGVRRVKARLNPQAQAAALEIYRELGGRWPPDDSRETAQDLGAMRNAFVRVFESGLPPPVAAKLWESLLKEARRLKKIYRANGGYQLAKCTWFKPILRDKLDARLKVM